MLLPDYEIRKRCFNPIFFEQGMPMLNPFSEGVQGNGVISYGLTSAGYDLRLATQVWAFKSTRGAIVDPKKFKDPEYASSIFDIFESELPITIPAHGYLLGRSIEYICIPKNLKGRCTGKSTMARAGIIVNMTPLEPGWHGHLTIEISNANPCPALIYPNEGIAQLEFELIDGIPELTYDKKGEGGGKYQGQKGVTPSKVL